MREVTREGWKATVDGSAFDFNEKVTVSKATGHNNWAVKLTGTDYVKIVHIKKNAIAFAEDIAVNGIPEPKAKEPVAEAPATPAADATDEANKLLGIA